MKTRSLLTGTALLTSTALLLAACGQGATPTSTAPTTSAPVTSPVTGPVAAPTPTKPAFVGGRVYAVSFQGNSSSTLSSSLRLVSGARLGGQALESVPDDFGYTLLSKDTFTVGSGSSSTRYVRATYQFTNNTGQTLTNLRFVPVDTDEDSDPATTTSQNPPPTVGSTTFTSLKYFDGSDASSTASSLTPGQGQTYNASTNAAQADGNASTFATGLDVTPLTPSAPSGQVIASVKNYAWNAATSLAPGASTNVTFSVSLPTDPAAPAKDPFAFTLVFTAAQDTPTVTAIHDVQGSTASGDAASPYAGKSVTVQGVVTAISQGTYGTGGFYIEAPDTDQDSDASTSEGLYVACDASCYAPTVGDVVRVTGTVSEVNTQTVLTAATSGVTLRASKAPLPTPVTVTLPVSSAGAWEAYEGMRVRVKGVVSNNYTLSRFNNVTVADSRPYSYTQKNSPSTTGYAAYLADLQKRTIIVDDLGIGQNAPTIFGDNNQPLSASNTLRTGDSADVTGVVTYAYAGGTSRSASALPSADPLAYRILTTQADAAFTGSRPAAPVVSGNVTVASANVLNFFTTLNGSASNTCTDNGNDSSATLKARGANNCTEYQRQLDKVVSNLAGLNADVTGLMEVQNDATVGSQGNEYTLATLVKALNIRLGGDIYAAVSNPNPGTDAIHVAMIYKKANVTPIGTALNDTDSINSRYPLAQVFQAAGGTKFAVVVNHLKSKGSGTGTGNTDISDGQGGSANMREQQVVRLLDLIQNRIVAPTSSGGQGVANVVAVGDFNAYDMEPSLVNLRKGQDGTAGTADDLSDVFSSDVYSYQFDGQFGSLDHAFVTQSMKALLSGGEKWHDNSDEPTALDYNTEFKSDAQDASYYDSSAYRSSDHDPLKVGFQLPTLSSLSVTASGNDTATPNQAYTLNLTTTGSPDSADIAWGDGTTSTVAVSSNAASTTHTYAAGADGSKPVSVKVTRNADSGAATTSKSVNVVTPALTLKSKGADPSFAAGSSGSVNATFTATNAAPLNFTATASSGLTVTSLTPGSTSSNGDTAVTANLSASAAGSYTVTINAAGSNGGGTSASATFNVTVTAASTAGKLVISQVYGGGGATSGNAAYNADYVELFNASSAAVSLDGKSLQYGAAGSSTTPSATFSGVLKLPAVSVQPYSYYLVQVSAPSSVGSNVPSPDFTGTSTSGQLSMSATSGKIAVVNGTTAVSSAASTSSLIDFVGYGTAYSYEGSAAAPTISTSLADFRAGSGCQDTNDNKADFTAAAASPRNSSTAANVCN